MVVRFLFLGGLLLQGLTMYVVQLAMASPEFKWVNAELEDSYWSFPLKPALRPWTMCPFVLAVSAKCACQCGMEIAESMLASDSVSEVMWTSDGMCHSFFLLPMLVEGGMVHWMFMHLFVSCCTRLCRVQRVQPIFFRRVVRPWVGSGPNVYAMQCACSTAGDSMWVNNAMDVCFINFGPRLLLGRNLSHMLKNALICFGMAMCNAVDSFILFLLIQWLQLMID